MSHNFLSIEKAYAIICYINVRNNEKELLI